MGEMMTGGAHFEIPDRVDVSLDVRRRLAVRGLEIGPHTRSWVAGQLMSHARTYLHLFRPIDTSSICFVGTPPHFQGSVTPAEQHHYPLPRHLLKRTDDVEDGISRGDVRQESIAKTLAV